MAITRFCHNFAAMNRHFTLIKHRCLFVFLLTVAAQALFAQRQEEWADKAYTYATQDSLAQAESCFKKAIEASPASQQSAILLANLGTIQRRRGKVKEAIESYSSALDRIPSSIPILIERAIAYMTLGNDDRAYTDLCNVLDKDATHIEALYYRAFIYTNRREYSAARTDYKSLLTTEPSHENAQLGLALLDQREGRLEAAEQQLSLLIECHPENATYWQARANVLIEQGLYDLALIDLDTAIALQPTDAYAYVARAELYLKMKRHAAAKEDLLRATSLGLSRAALSDLYEQCK